MLAAGLRFLFKNAQRKSYRCTSLVYHKRENGLLYIQEGISSVYLMQPVFQTYLKWPKLWKTASSHHENTCNMQHSLNHELFIWTKCAESLISFLVFRTSFLWVLEYSNILHKLVQKDNLQFPSDSRYFSLNLGKQNKYKTWFLIMECLWSNWGAVIFPSRMFNEARTKYISITYTQQNNIWVLMEKLQYFTLIRRLLKMCSTDVFYSLRPSNNKPNEAWKR